MSAASVKKKSLGASKLPAKKIQTILPDLSRFIVGGTKLSEVLAATETDTKFNWNPTHIKLISKTSPPAIPKREIRDIQKSANQAFDKAALIFSAEGRRRNRLKRRKGYTKSHFSADELLAKLAYSPRPSLGKADVQSIIVEAGDRNDIRFFIRLGKVLARKAIQQPVYVYLPKRWLQFLIYNWVKPYIKQLPPLCQLTTEGLVDVCNLFTNESLTKDAIDKDVQRFGLIKSSGKRIRVKRSENTLEFS